MKHLRQSSFHFGLAGMAAAIAFAAPLRADNAPAAPPTYAHDIAPIINAHCAECHRPGQIGPMTLLNFDEVRPWAKSIKKSVADRAMPPWHADPAFGHFKNDARLKDDDVAKIVAWVDAGAPSGDLAQAPAAPKFEDGGWRFGKPDQVFKIDPFKVADEVDDHYEHFLIKTGLTEDKFISGVEIKAGAPSAVHHILVFLMPEGDVSPDIMRSGAIMRATFLTGWAPGTNAMQYQPNFGKKIPAGTNMILQIHYHKNAGPGTGVTDQSMVAFKYATEPVANPTTTAWVMDPGIEIPAGDANYQSISRFEFQDEGWILGLVPHMHLRGKSFQFIADFPDGTSETLLSVPKYDFNWQLAYELAEPRVVPRGTVVRAIAHWDNSAANPANPDPTQTVYFGEATTDEMMIGFMEYAYKTRKGSQARFGMPEGMMNVMGGRGRGGEGGGRGLDNANGLMQRMKERHAGEGAEAGEGGGNRMGRRRGGPGGPGREGWQGRRQRRLNEPGEAAPAAPESPATEAPAAPPATAPAPAPPGESK